jgi:curved DNA-binding protein CbpA
MSGRPDHYSVLGVPRDADAAAVRKAYHDLAMKWHPDKNPSNKDLAQAKFQEIVAAYEILSDPDKRAAYNRDLKQKEHVQPEAPHRPGLRSPFHVGPSPTDSDDDDLGYDESDSDSHEDLAHIFVRLARKWARDRHRAETRGFDPRKVHIFGMSPVTGSLDVQRAFSVFGTVTDVFIMRDKRTRISLGKGFVTFASEEACCCALEARETMTTIPENSRMPLQAKPKKTTPYRIANGN